jgi:hypothetical protein
MKTSSIFLIVLLILTLHALSLPIHVTNAHMNIDAGEALMLGLVMVPVTAIVSLGVAAVNTAFKYMVWEKSLKSCF